MIEGGERVAYGLLVLGLTVDSEIRVPSIMSQNHHENGIVIHFVEQVIRKLPKVRPAQAAGVEMVTSGVPFH